MGLSNSQPVTVEASLRSVILQTRINSRFPLATTHTAGLGWYSMCEGEFNLWPKHRAGRAHGMAFFVVVGSACLQATVVSPRRDHLWPSDHECKKKNTTAGTGRPALPGVGRGACGASEAAAAIRRLPLPLLLVVEASPRAQGGQGYVCSRHLARLDCTACCEDYEEQLSLTDQTLGEEQHGNRMSNTEHDSSLVCHTRHDPDLASIA